PVDPEKSPLFWKPPKMPVTPKGDIKWPEMSDAEIARQAAIAEQQTRRVYEPPPAPAPAAAVPPTTGIIDLGAVDTASSRFAQAFGDGADRISGAAQALASSGGEAADTLRGAAGGIGGAIGAAAAAVISAARVHVDIPTTGSGSKVDVGTRPS